MAERSESVRVSRLNSSFPRTAIDRAIVEAVRKLHYSRATDDQANTIREFALGRDVFITLPTGCGKSLCYAGLPYVFDYLRVQAASPSNVHVVCKHVDHGRIALLYSTSFGPSTMRYCSQTRASLTYD